MFHLESLRPYWNNNLFWNVVFSKILLGVNDTQLFTGTAVQIVSLLQLCTLSVYHFRVVTELAYLSTVTHLLTLIVLRNYFVKNKWVNIYRVLIMIVNLALLGYTTWIEYALDTLDSTEDGTNVGCYLGMRQLPSTHLSTLRWAMLLFIATTAHFSVFWTMYWEGEFTLGLLTRKQFWWLKSWGRFVRNCIFLPAYTIYGLVVGIQVLRKTQAFGSAPIPIIGTERDWGFGQVLAVFLLTLIVLPGWEAFFE